MVTETLPKRSEIPVELTWDLTKIYASDDAWEADFSKLRSMLPELEGFAGKLAQDAKTLLQALELDSQASLIMDKLYAYSHMRLHVDTTNSVYQALSDRASSLLSELSAATAYLRPEILSIPEETLKSFVSTDQGLKLYEFRLEELNRERPHVRSAEVESLLAQASEIVGAPDRIYSMLTDADKTLPVIKTADGREIQLTDGNYAEVFLRSNNRQDRKAAYEAMMGWHKSMRNTIASTYASQVKGNIFRARARNYKSSLEQALSSINVPISVYETLIATVRKNLPKLHRYLRLRKKLLGIEQLRMYDLYTPLIKNANVKVPYEEAQKLVLAGLEPLGKEYVSELQKGLQSRWIDVMETANKRSGAYSWGCFGHPPFMLLNWQDGLDSTFTLAHEIGHSMHSFLTWRTQPYVYGSYTLFVAEVASTCNESLLTQYLLKTKEDPAIKAHVINMLLEDIRTTLIRQTLFAEFEKRAHEAAEQGEALTPEMLCGIHRQLNADYYGAEVEMDDWIENEWMRIPHFYSSFYVYQYATGISAALALSRQILEEGQPAVNRYLKFLSSGCSDYSINLLRQAGVDLSTPEPVQQAFDLFEEYLDKFEQLSN